MRVGRGGGGTKARGVLTSVLTSKTDLGQLAACTLRVAAMGWLEFLSSVIESLAWPAAIAFVVYLLRNQIRALLAGLRSLAYGGVRAEFGEHVQEAEIAAEGAELPSELTPGSALSTELWPEISSAPRAAVIEAWLAVERELEALAERSGVDPVGR
jgi:hypothetical protein